MRRIVHRIVLGLTLAIFLLVQKPLPSQAALTGNVWYGCTLHLDYATATQIVRRQCVTYAMPREHRTRTGWKITRARASLHVIRSVRWPTFYVAPPPAPPLTGFIPAVARWTPYIVEASNRSGIPARIIAATIMQESTGDPYVGCTSGFDGCDLGLMQYGPLEASDGIAQCGIGAYTADPRLNIITGSCFLAWTLRHCAGGNLYVAVAKYNGGCGGGNYGYAASVYRWAGM
jgi:Transglycosylase SLT domain